ncbi:MAG TPA: hypothetical protein VFB28_07845 [Terriglobales bacterium]|nr:hypothetical protein [Terriglobales bacterium]
MNPVSQAAKATSLSADERAKKLNHAARQFEAVLLNQLFDSLEHTFSVLGEEKTSAGADQYRFLGIQALCSRISEHGGLGIADMIVRNVEAREARLSTTKKPL